MSCSGWELRKLGTADDAQPRGDEGRGDNDVFELADYQETIAVDNESVAEGRGKLRRTALTGIMVEQGRRGEGLPILGLGYAQGPVRIG